MSIRWVLFFLVGIPTAFLISKFFVDGVFDIMLEDARREKARDKVLERIASAVERDGHEK